MDKNDIIKVAIIIPLYYEANITKQCLDSLKNQTKRDNIVLYLINDCSPNTNCEYQDLIQEYIQYFEIKYFKTEKNVGQGLTRQLGLQNVQEKYVIFIDQDDYLNQDNVIEIYLNHLQQESYVFIEPSQLIIQNNIQDFGNSDCFTGTIFNVNFLKENQINFTLETSRIGEDALFRTKCYLFCKLQNKKYLKLSDYFYVHKYTNTLKTITWDLIQEQKIPESLIIIAAENIKFIHTNNNFINWKKRYIIHQLTIFYQYSYILLFILEEKGLYKYFQKDKDIFYEDWLYLINLINKNIKIIERQPTLNENPFLENINKYIPKISWENFCKTFKERFQQIK